jgi:hypothetical protein
VTTAAPSPAVKAVPEPVTAAPNAAERPTAAAPSFRPTEEITASPTTLSPTTSTTTSAPTTGTGGDTPKTPDEGDGTGTDTDGQDTAADGASAASYDRFSLMLFGAAIVMTAYGIYRYCFQGGASQLTSGLGGSLGGSGGGPNYAPLSTSEENSGFLGGDIEMSGGARGSYDGELWLFCVVYDLLGSR